MRAVDFDAQLFKPQPFDIANNANRRNHRVKAVLFHFAAGFNMRGHSAFAAIKLFHHGLFHDGHTLFHKSLFGKGGNLGVFDWQDPIHDLDNGRIGPERVIKARKFDPNGTRPDHQELFRHARRNQRVFIGPYQITIRLKARQFPRPRASCQNDRRCGQLFDALISFDRDFAFGRQARLAHDHRDLVLLHQMADATVQLFGHPARAFHHCVQIIGHARRAQPIVFGVIHQVKHLRRPQHRFGRDTAPVQTDPAHMFAFHDGDLLAKLRRPDRRHIAPRTCTDHNHIKAFRGHGLSPRKFCTTLIRLTGSAMQIWPRNILARPIQKLKFCYIFRLLWPEAPVR